MKKYIKPEMAYCNVEVESLLAAESLTINNGETVDGSNALGKESNPWADGEDIWEE